MTDVREKEELAAAKAAQGLPSQAEILMNEDQLLAGLLEAANFKQEPSNYRKIQIRRGGKTLFEFRIRPIEEEELQACRRRATKMIPNPAGRHLPKVEGETDYVRLRSLKILTATVEEDRPKIWGNKALQSKLNVLTDVDVIDSVLMAGEKDWVCDAIDEISGYHGERVELEEYAKN